MSSPPESASPVREGEVIAGKYRVDRVLGEGGMGVVVAVTHLGLNQRFAMKFLLPEVATMPALVMRFMREAQAAVQIHSEHVCRVVDVGALETGSPYMLMEYLEGQDLGQVLSQRGALAPQEAVGYALEAMEALAEAHVLGIVHRDLKPGNLFLARRPSGQSIVKVLDFGISKVSTSPTQPALTGSGALIGSPGYMSPEQMVAAETVDRTTDIWALGVVLYEMLTGARPFDAQTMPELVAMVLAKPHRSLREARPDLPEPLATAVDVCLRKERSERWQDVGQLARALAPFGPPHAAQLLPRILGVLGQPLDAPVPSLSAPPGAPSARHEAGTFSPTASRAVVAARSSAGLYAGIGVLAVVALGAAGIVWALTHGYGRRARPELATSTIAVASASPPTPASVSVVAPPASVVVADGAKDAPDAAATVPAVPPPGTSHAGIARPHTAPAASSAPAAASSAPVCKTVAYFDTDGEKHFKQECK